MVHFESRQVLDNWDKQIQSLCFQVFFLDVIIIGCGATIPFMKDLPDKSVIFAGELCDRQNLNNRAGVAEQDNGVADAGVTLFEL